jgi:hypothetical protein
MFEKFFWISFAVFTLTLNHALSGPDLCKNPKIDSIVWVERNEMWFFTSGGYYYYIKDGIMPPPKSEAKPLPSGFKVGEAAVLRETEVVCGKEKTDAMGKNEVLIYLVEMVGDSNKIHIFDTRVDESKRWITGSIPLEFNNDHSVGQAKVDKTKSIDAMVSRGSQLYLIQGSNYAGIDLTPLCADTNSFANSLDVHSITEFGTNNAIDAMTITTDNKKALMFAKEQFWYVKLNDPKSGSLAGIKDNIGQQIDTDFLKCGPGGQPETNDTSITNGPQQTEASQPTQDRGLLSTGSSGGGEKSSATFIILGVVAAVIVVIVISLIAVIAIRKKKSGADSEADGMAAGAAEVSAGATGKDSIDGKVGGSKVGSKVDSKVGSKVGSQVSPSKTGSKMLSSLGGTSPSKMSVRSMMSTAPKGMESKSSPKSAVDKQSSAVKSSIYKK